MNTNPKARRILCYGDSLTWGYIPGTDHQRYAVNERWTGILQNLLGNDYEIIEEGLNSRTLASDDPRPGKEGRDGSKTLIPCLDSHDPLDLVILMLGTNELKDTFQASVAEIGKLLEEKYIQIILNRKSPINGTHPRLLLISPPQLDLSKAYAQERYLQSEDKSKQLADLYQDIAEHNNIDYMAAHDYVRAGEDGVHLDQQANKLLAGAISATIQRIMLQP